MVLFQYAFKIQRNWGFSCNTCFTNGLKQWDNIAFMILDTLVPVNDYKFSRAFARRWTAIAIPWFRSQPESAHTVLNMYRITTSRPSNVLPSVYMNITPLSEWHPKQTDWASNIHRNVWKFEWKTWRLISLFIASYEFLIWMMMSRQFFDWLFYSAFFRFKNDNLIVLGFLRIFVIHVFIKGL